MLCLYIVIFYFISCRCQVYSWGDNDHGQLGSGSTSVGRMPSGVSVLDGFKISRVACGSSHTFAWTTPIETVPSVEHQIVMYPSTSDPIGTAAVLHMSDFDGDGEALSPFDIVLKHRPTLSKIIFSLPDNSRRQEAIHTLLQALQISYARDAVVSALASDIPIPLGAAGATDSGLVASMSAKQHALVDIQSAGKEAVTLVGNDVWVDDDLAVGKEHNSASHPDSVPEFMQRLTEGDARLLLDLLKLAVGGRVNETGRVALSHTLKMLGKTRLEVSMCEK